MDPYHYVAGTVPVVVSIPHAGTYVPEAILERFGDAAKQLPDTDWHVEKLYAFARDMGVHMLAAVHSRLVVDVNRAPDGSSLYPGQFTTGLVPMTLFDGSPVYGKGQEPDEAEIGQRMEDCWQPYHHKLQALIAELKARHGRVALFDAHSICSRVPTLFEGVLPDLNFGTADGSACDENLESGLFLYGEASPYSSVINGRFKGGYITRHYGNPLQGVDAVQLELAQHNYMEEAYPFTYDETKAARLQETLRGIMDIIVKRGM